MVVKFLIFLCFFVSYERISSSKSSEIIRFCSLTPLNPSVWGTLVGTWSYRMRESQKKKSLHTNLTSIQTYSNETQPISTQSNPSPPVSFVLKRTFKMWYRIVFYTVASFDGLKHNISFSTTPYLPSNTSFIFIHSCPRLCHTSN